MANVSKPERIWKWVDKSAPNGCWLWTGTLINSGYGKFDCKWSKSNLAHRNVYQLCVGPIPDGMHLCHRCDTPRCVNPAHLFIGTAADNMQDAYRKGRVRVPKADWQNQPRNALGRFT